MDLLHYPAEIPEPAAWENEPPKAERRSRAGQAASAQNQIRNPNRKGEQLDEMSNLAHVGDHVGAV